MSTISSPLPTPPDNFSTQIASATVSSSALTFQVDDASGLPSEGVGVLFKKDSSGDIVAGSIEFIHWTSVSSNTINLTDVNDRGLTGSDSGAQSYVADDWFEVWVTSYYYDSQREAYVAEHNTDGTHSDITTDSINNAGALTQTGNATFNDRTTFSDERVGTIHDNGNSGAAATINFTNGETQKITLTDNCTFTFSNVTEGAYLTLWLIQDGTGSRTVTWPSGTKHPGGTAPTLTTDASAIDIVGIRAYGASTYHVVANALDLS